MVKSQIKGEGGQHDTFVERFDELLAVTWGSFRVSDEFLPEFTFLCKHTVHAIVKPVLPR